MQLIQAIKAHALLHRAQRARDAKGAVVATVSEDYKIVRSLMADVLASAAALKVREQLVETCAAVRKIVPELFKPGVDHDARGAKVAEVAEHLELDHSAAWRRLKSAEERGLVVNIEDRRGRPGRYRATGEEMKVSELLPTSTKLQRLFETEDDDTDSGGHGQAAE
jgi:hypothetical protein